MSMLYVGIFCFLVTFIFIIVWNFALINPSIFNKILKHKDEALKFMVLSIFFFITGLFFLLHGFIDDKPIHINFNGLRQKLIIVGLGLAVFYFGFFIFRNRTRYIEQLKESGYRIPQNLNRFEKLLKIVGLSIMLFTVLSLSVIFILLN